MKSTSSFVWFKNLLVRNCGIDHLLHTPWDGFLVGIMVCENNKNTFGKSNAMVVTHLTKILNSLKVCMETRCYKLKKLSIRLVEVV